MQKFFRVFEELVFFDLWIPDSGSAFQFPGFRVAPFLAHRPGLGGRLSQRKL